MLYFSFQLGSDAHSGIGEAAVPGTRGEGHVDSALETEAGLSPQFPGSLLALPHEGLRRGWHDGKSELWAGHLGTGGIAQTPG